MPNPVAFRPWFALPDDAGAANEKGTRRGNERPRSENILEDVTINDLMPGRKARSPSFIGPQSLRCTGQHRSLVHSWVFKIFFAC